MIESLMWFAVALNLGACAFNTHAYFKNKKFYEKTNKLADRYLRLVFGKKRELFKELGAYKAPEGNKLYIDLEGGIRLVIDNGEIEGWYKCD